MFRLNGVTRNHDWGSPDAIPHFLGADPDGDPWAELWFGAHPLGPATLSPPLSQSAPPTSSTTSSSGRQRTLPEEIARAPQRTLGPSTQLMFGDELPYLVKLIAPARALSLQVHPGRTQAADGYADENQRGLALGAPTRAYQDPTHKPEMLYAITRFEALVGFAVRRQARERLEGLDCVLASRLSLRLRFATGRGVKPVVAWILDPQDGPTPEEIADFAAACAARVATGKSPAPDLDATIVRLQQEFPGEAGIAICFLMNHVVVDPGKAIFVPTGTVHSYQRGLGLEVMANSDNVVRAGLTSKHVDRRLFLDTALFDGLPPTRIAPEHPIPGINLFRSPVEDFELSVASPAAPGATSPLPIPGTGPRILVALEGSLTAETRLGSIEMHRGQAAFVPDFDGPVLVTGDGQIAQVSVP